jgi:hypothetical protein
MRVIQIMLVEAEGLQDAIDEVRSRLVNQDTGEINVEWAEFFDDEKLSLAGSWAGFFGEDLPDVICYADHKALADEKIALALEGRKDALNDYIKRGKNYKFGKYDPYKAEFNSDAYSMEKAMKIVNDQWTFESGIYDLENWTASLMYFKKMSEVDPERLYLVPVSFKF